MIKVNKRKILLLPGDGIGPEVIGEVKKIVTWFNKKKSMDFELDEDLAGGCSYDKHGTPITDEVFYKALESSFVMLGAVGGPLGIAAGAGLGKMASDATQFLLGGGKSAEQRKLEEAVKLLQQRGLI